MKLNKPNSKFYRWWNSYSGRRIISAAYSIGASIVILGALFKILHLPFGNIMLGVGMSVESIIFALGIFDKPFREYDWTKIFDFKTENEQRLNTNPTYFAQQHLNNSENLVVNSSGDNAATKPSVRQESQTVGQSIVIPSEVLTEDDTKKLSESIKNLAETAQHLQSLADIALIAGGLSKNIESATEATANFANTLANSYQSVNSEIDQVLNSTKSYSKNVESVNKNIASINSIYEMQLRYIQSQTDNLNLQAEAIRRATEGVDDVANNMDKMKEAANIAQIESKNYEAATRKLSRQVEDLNAVYGNMLNALS